VFFIEDLIGVIRSKLIVLPNWGPLKADKLLKGIEESKKQPFERIIVSLGIPNIGQVIIGLYC
jgi:NAD-dependent DNA ligase